MSAGEGEQFRREFKAISPAITVNICYAEEIYAQNRYDINVKRFKINRLEIFSTNYNELVMKNTNTD
jgi:hypothetical protein